MKAVSERDTHVGFSSQSFSDGGSTPPASIIFHSYFVLSEPLMSVGARRRVKPLQLALYPVRPSPSPSKVYTRLKLARSGSILNAHAGGEWLVLCKPINVGPLQPDD